MIISEPVEDLFINGCSVQVHIEFSITQSDGRRAVVAPQKTVLWSSCDRLPARLAERKPTQI